MRRHGRETRVRDDDDGSHGHVDEEAKGTSIGAKEGRSIIVVKAILRSVEKHSENGSYDDKEYAVTIADRAAREQLIAAAAMAAMLSVVQFVRRKPSAVGRVAKAWGRQKNTDSSNDARPRRRRLLFLATR